MKNTIARFVREGVGQGQIKSALRAGFISTVAVVLFGMATSASAQTCAGYGSFREHGGQIGVGGGFSSGSQGLAVTASGGGEQLFGTASFAASGFDNIDGALVSLGGGVGSDIAVDASRRVYVCPTVGAAFVTGDLNGMDISGFNVESGGRIGIIAGQTPTVDVIPTVGGRVVYARTKSEFLFFEDTVTQTYGLADIGVGFVFNRRYALVPMVSIPIGVDDSNVSFGVNLGINF
ncbi:MAG: hypothetical protein ACRD2X_26675 [Vicinamibacteraceae bacterium]